MLLSARANNGKYYGYVILEKATPKSLALVKLIKEFNSVEEYEKFTSTKANTVK